MPSPDLRALVDLTLYDKTQQDLYNAAVADLASSLPDWIPREGNTEVLLLEELAQQVSEAVFAINRLPGAVMSILFQLFNITQNIGTQPTTTVTFNLSDTAGHTIPKGTRLMLALDNGLLPIVFTTDSALTVAVGSSSGTVSATGDRYTSEGNNIASGTDLSILDGLVYVDSAVTASAVTGGVDPETTASWQSRAVQQLNRLSDTLVTPDQFTSAALTYSYAYRVKTIDNYSPAKNLFSVDAASFESGTGNWSVDYNVGIAQSAAQWLDGTHSLAVTASAAGDAYVDSEHVKVVPNLTYTALVSLRPDATARATQAILRWLDSSGNTISSVSGTVVNETLGGWSKITVSGQAPSNAVTAYIAVLIGGCAAGEIHYIDCAAFNWGSSTDWTPGGTAQAIGNDPGNITLAVYGENSTPLTADQVSSLQSALSSQAETNLAVFITGPDVTVQNVNVTVVGVAGAAAADVQSAVTSALQNYLSTDTWAWGGTLYLNELIALVSNVANVDRVVNFTTPNADVAISGVAPLLKAGQITVTVQ